MYLNIPDPGLDDLSWMSMSLDVLLFIVSLHPIRPPSVSVLGESPLVCIRNIVKN